MTPPTLAQSVAPEDLQIGDFITVLSVVRELPPFLWSNCEFSLPPDELVRLKCVPEGAGLPMKVIAVCLPFVYVRCAGRTVQILDLRFAQVVRLDRKCAKEIWRHTKNRMVVSS